MLFWTNYFSRKSTTIFPNSIPLQGLNDKYSCLSGKPISKVTFEDSFFFLFTFLSEYSCFKLRCSLSTECYVIVNETY